MIYIFQRIIQNDYQWTRPSRGRLGHSGEGRYVQENGFGYEDWNFNKNLLIDSFMYGYCYYQPSENKRNEKFNITFATYTNKRWYLIGFYVNAEFIDNPPIKYGVVKQKMNNLKLLGNSLGDPWRKLGNEEFNSKLMDESQVLKWRVTPDNAVRTDQPLVIPKKMFDTRNYRMARPTEIDKKTFDSLFNLAASFSSEEDYGDDSEFPEGKEVEKKHRLRERNQAVIKMAKIQFKKKHKKLCCQVCGFDFHSKYGKIGLDFIEGHHTMPLSEIKGVVKTKVKDIALVCSNCHRMLHKKRPWLKMKVLKKLIDR